MHSIDIDEYKYDLPDSRIAAHPIADRDQSKLLVYKDGEISHQVFDQITAWLPPDATLFFNNTKVIPARILFSKPTGASIEIFLLKPAGNVPIQQALAATGDAKWLCTIGNLKRWPDGTVLSMIAGESRLNAFLEDRQEGLVRFSWTPADLSFADILAATGKTPLPPYIKRPADSGDQTRYQTVYSTADGAVAAPTAGLHFTDKVLNNIAAKGLLTEYLTLHVSAGTFQPVKVKNAAEHVMHEEQIIVTIKNLETMLLPDKKIIAVGTTSLRTLESLFWYGVKLLEEPDAEFTITQHDPYTRVADVSMAEAIGAVLVMMRRNSMNTIQGTTAIYIMPGYSFRVCSGLITNFHQPGSTLMLLVAAFVGEDWKRIYADALKGDYRFLSYGDSSLLLI